MNETWWRTGFDTLESLFRVVDHFDGLSQLWSEVFCIEEENNGDEMIEQFWAIQQGLAEFPEEA